MNSQICIIGTIATDPRKIRTATDTPMCSFRLASNDRRYDRESNAWVDGETNWFTVNAFRNLADHSEQSFSKGDRVIVSGRLRVRNWTRDDKSGTAVEVDADAVGHDVRFGISTFRKHRSADADSVDEPAEDRADVPAERTSGDPSAAPRGTPDETRASDGFLPVTA